MIFHTKYELSRVHEFKTLEAYVPSNLDENSLEMLSQR